jgi:hypothetical protein
MVRRSSTVIVATTLLSAASTLAIPLRQFQYQVRELDERDYQDAPTFMIRDDFSELDARELDERADVKNSPSFFQMHLRDDLFEFDARELDERADVKSSPSFFQMHLRDDLSELDARELYERTDVKNSPNFFQMHLRDDPYELDARDLEARDFWRTMRSDVGQVVGTALNVIHLREEELPEFEARELDERNFITLEDEGIFEREYLDLDELQ